MLEQGIQSMCKGPLKDYGCFFLCVCKYAELQEGIGIAKERLENLWNMAHACGYINADHNIVMHGDLYRLVTDGADRHYKKRLSLATLEDHTNRYIKELHKPGYTHFVLQNGADTWDPLDPKRPTANSYTSTVSYREFI
jgi:hypothetical protein